MSTLVIHRSSEFANWLRAYHIFADGERIGRVRSGAEVRIPVSAGFHTVELKVDWCRSNPVRVEVGEGQDCVLHCGCNFTGLRLFRGVGRVFTDPQHYLWLRLAGES